MSTGMTLSSSTKSPSVGDICISSSPARSTPPMVLIFRLLTTPSMGAVSSVCCKTLWRSSSLKRVELSSSWIFVASWRASCRYLLRVDAIFPSSSTTWRLARIRSMRLTSPLANKRSFSCNSSRAELRVSCSVARSASSPSRFCLYRASCSATTSGYLRLSLLNTGAIDWASARARVSAAAKAATRARLSSTPALARSFSSTAKTSPATTVWPSATVSFSKTPPSAAWMIWVRALGTIWPCARTVWSISNNAAQTKSRAKPKNSTLIMRTCTAPVWLDRG